MLDKTKAAAMLQDISERIETGDANLHCVLAMNWMFRQPNASEVFDEAIKGQAMEVWTELSNAGLELERPPILFGLPDDF